jgi:hypothetical protein
MITQSSSRPAAPRHLEAGVHLLFNVVVPAIPLVAAYLAYAARRGHSSQTVREQLAGLFAGGELFILAVGIGASGIAVFVTKALLEGALARWWIAAAVLFVVVQTACLEYGMARADLVDSEGVEVWNFYQHSEVYLISVLVATFALFIKTTPPRRVVRRGHHSARPDSINDWS